MCCFSFPEKVTSLHYKTCHFNVALQSGNDTDFFAVVQKKKNFVRLFIQKTVETLVDISNHHCISKVNIDFVISALQSCEQKYSYTHICLSPLKKSLIPARPIHGRPDFRSRKKNEIGHFKNVFKLHTWYCTRITKHMDAFTFSDLKVPEVSFCF